MTTIQTIVILAFYSVAMIALVITSIMKVRSLISRANASVTKASGLIYDMKARQAEREFVWNRVSPIFKRLLDQDSDTLAIVTKYEYEIMADWSRTRGLPPPEKFMGRDIMVVRAGKDNSNDVNCGNDDASPENPTGPIRGSS